MGYAHGFISKETQEWPRPDRLPIRVSAHSLLPTPADCLGLVLCEANAFSVPAFANDVGGVGEVVKPGINGYLFLGPMPPASDRADCIAETFNRSSGIPRHGPYAAVRSSRSVSTGTARVQRSTAPEHFPARGASRSEKPCVPGGRFTVSLLRSHPQSSRSDRV